MTKTLRGTVRLVLRASCVLLALAATELGLGQYVAAQPGALPTPASAGATLSPWKSPNDDRAYRYLELDNGLAALLVSDTDAPKAAAALDVRVGHGENPRGRGGLAHFLEHMLFLGTDKYPDPAEYERYITEHGGSRNAYTSFEHTNYFFDIEAPYLPEALDRFAQFFIAPRFDEEYVDREKNAVEAEYQMGLNSDGRRALDVIQAVMNPEHPYSQFGVGNLESLADRPGESVREALLAFYREHYSADRMRLVVLGRESLDELENMVRERFAAVPARTQTRKAADVPPLFVSDRLPMRVELRAKDQARQLEVNFEVPEYRTDYRAKPLAYLGNLIGHEGEGSLLSLLKAEGLAESLGAGAGLAWHGGELFSISIALTESGVERQQRVLDLLFAYLAMLREEGPQRWLYEEQARIAALAFRFQEEGRAMGFASGTANGMHTLAPADVLVGNYLMQRFPPAQIEEALAVMVPEKAVVMVTLPAVEGELRSPWYDVPYTVSKLDPSALAGPVEPTVLAALHLPAPNEFIAEDVARVPLEEENPPVPALVFEEGRQRIWFRQVEDFPLPRGATYINFRSPAVAPGPYEHAAASLYTRVVEDAVNEFSYPARLAGLSFSFYNHAQGVSLRVSGYTDKQQVLLERLLDVIGNNEFDAERIERIREDMLRGLRDTAAQRPTSLVIGDLQETLSSARFDEPELVQALEAMGPEELIDFGERFWADASAESLLFGNYRRAAVEELAATLSGFLPDKAANAAEPLRILRLGAGEAVQLPRSTPHDDAVVAWYWQGAGTSWRDRAAMGLAAQVMKSGFFQELRTEQQLGYVVSASPFTLHTVPGFLLLVQSPSHSAAAVTSAMDEFLGSVTDVDAEAFARHKAALVGEILEPDRNLGERAEFYWQSIARDETDFGSREALASAVEALALADWQAYMSELLDSPRTLRVVAPGAREALPALGSEWTQASSPESLVEEHEFYVFP